MRYNLIFNILSLTLKYIGVLFLAPVLVAILLNENKEILPFIITAFISIIIGFVFSFNNADKKDIDNIKKTESLVTVLFAWLLFSLICSIPYLFYGFSFTDACFEAVSGVTTTGGSITACYSICELSCSNSSSFIGGIAGRPDASSSIVACYALIESCTGCMYSSGIHASSNNSTVTACYWKAESTYPNKGTGWTSATANESNAVKVDGTSTTWSAAMNAMNTALSGTGWLYEDNTNPETKGDFPLIIVPQGN